MERKEFKLDRETNDIRIKTFCYDISVYPDNVKSPIVLVKGDVDIKNDWNYMRYSKFATIEEKLKNVNKTRMKHGKNNGIFYSSASSSQTIIISNNGNVTVNGYTMDENEVGNIELVVPNKGHINSIEIKSVSGNINAKNINIGTILLDRLIAETVSGRITLEEFQAMYTRLETTSGSISAEILESMVNYVIDTNTLSGNSKIYSEEVKNPQFTYGDRYHLDAKSVSGDIKILFKGK